MTAQLAPRSAGAVTRGRLTDEERRWRAMSEDELQAAVTDLAVILGWHWLHIGALRTKYGWRTPTRGTLSAWPDLTLVRERDRRLIVAELKRELEQPKPEQLEVLDVLRSLAFDGTSIDPLANRIRVGPRIEVFLWRPSDLADPIETSRIYEVLR
jgi:hypothetical protein